MATARLRYLRIAPRKMRVLADMVRGKPVAQAIEELRFTQRSGARPLFKLLVSAVANAEQAMGDVDLDRLVVSRITVDQGPTLKRWRPRAMGRATRIDKKTSHVFVELSETA